MSNGVKKNFRGLRALVIHPDDGNRATLVTALKNLRLHVVVMEPGAEVQADADSCDLVFFDADEGIGSIFPEGDLSEVASIAIIGTEAPSRLARVVRHRSASHILKPIRNSGVFTAIFVAINEFEKRQTSLREIDRMRQRLAGRRILIKAILHLMATCNVDEDDAYERLRVESMNRRIPIEEMARESLGNEKKPRGTKRVPRISRRVPST